MDIINFLDCENASPAGSRMCYHLLNPGSVMKRYKLIANPAAGRGNARSLIRKAESLFRGRGISFDLEFTHGPGDAADVARRSLPDFDVVVAMGGDGTVNEVLPGLLFSGKPLGIIPCGSGNDFIKSLGIPNNIEKAFRILQEGKEKAIDIGTINGKPFANGVGIGFDAAVNRTSYSINHSKKGLLLYFLAFLRTIGKYRPSAAKITADGNTMEQETFLISVGNGTTVGGGFRLTPHAKIDDGLLDLTVVKPLPLPLLFWHLPKVFLGTIDRTPHTITLRAQKIRIKTPSPVPAHLDGEIYDGDATAFDIEILPGALTVIGNFSRPASL